MVKSSKTHLSELLLAARLHAKKDPLHTGKNRFSDDILQVNAILHDPKIPKLRKIKAYRDWLVDNQPCLFGKSAANKRQVFVCLLDEDELIRMRRGDDDVKETIRDHQMVWKRHALHGLSSSFLILIVSKSIAELAPGPELKEISRRLMELYVDSEVDDDEILTRREWVYLYKQSANPQLLKFATLPNIFCAQGDRRWWHDHRTPGALMITSNALGHFMHCLAGASAPPNTTQALRRAMTTIQGAYKGRKGDRDLPATQLLARPENEETPLSADKDLCPFSGRNYSGKFHTDYLIPSTFFDDKTPTEKYDDLDFSYIFDSGSDEHGELMLGIETDWYSVARDTWIGKGKDWKKLQRNFEFSIRDRGEAAHWLASRIKERCE